MIITHNHEEMFNILAPAAESYGGIELLGNADNWERKQYSFRDLREKKLDKSTLIRLFTHSPKVPVRIRRTFACLCAMRVLPLYRNVARDDDLPEHLLHMGWRLVRGMNVRGEKELTAARRSASRAFTHKRVKEMSALAALGAVRSTLHEGANTAAANAAFYARDARYYAMIKNRKGEKMARKAIEAERDQQIADIIILTEEKSLFIFKKTEEQLRKIP